MTILDSPPGSTGSPESPSPGRSNAVFGLLLTLIGAAIVLTAVGLVAIAVFAVVNDDDGGGSGSAIANTQLDIQLSEFSIEGDLAAPAGNVTLNVANAGAIEHNLAVRELGVTSRNLQSRGVDTVELMGLTPGSYELFCSIAGHEAAGMVANLEVTDADSFEPAQLRNDDHAGQDIEALEQAMLDSILAFPAETEGLGNQILEPEILADGTKKFTLVAEVIPWEVSPGEWVDAWAYNGQVPGPQIKVDVGDNLQIELTNLTPMSTDIHWHGIQTPNVADGVSPLTQDPIMPGETYVYEFPAVEPAIGMYHAHMHSQVSVLNGMFAAFQIGDNPLPRGQTISGIEIPADLEVAFEEPMVLNDAGTIGLSLNGKSFPATTPIVMTEGEWGVIHYYNEGLTAHPMHLHQFPQLVYAKDGTPLDHPYWADTVNIAPGERYSVLFQADTQGAWVFHCHILTHVERDEGMFGMVTAVIVTDPNAA